MIRDSMENYMAQAIKHDIIGYTEDSKIALEYEKQSFNKKELSEYPLGYYYGEKKPYRITKVKEITSFRSVNGSAED